MFVIQPIDADQIASLCTKLAQSGTTLTGGPVDYSIDNPQHGIKATAAYDVADGSLTVTVTHKPFYITEGMIQSGIEEAIKP